MVSGWQNGAVGFWSGDTCSMAKPGKRVVPAQAGLADSRMSGSQESALHWNTHQALAARAGASKDVRLFYRLPGLVGCP